MPDTFGAAFGRLIKRRRAEKRLTQAQLACALYPNLDPEEAEKRKGDISKLETGKVANPEAQTVQRLAHALDISDDEIDALQRRVQMTASEQLENLPALDRDQLELLASRFDILRPHAMDERALRDNLMKRAEDYQALKSEVDQIDDGLKRLSNLKSAAQDAIARVDLEEVEELLSRVQEVELEEAAKTAELRANNALLRGNVDQAYALLSAAADSFAAVDPVEPARRRNTYRSTLYRHGLRYGGPGLQRSIDIIRPAIAALEGTDNTRDWAGYTQNLGLALRDQGIRTAGPEGADLLAQAVAAYRDALRVLTEADHPVDWAMTLQNLGAALRNQGIRTAGPEGADLLAQAVSAYRDALRVRTEADHPVDWAVTMQNLGVALKNQGTRTDGPEGADLLAQSVSAYRDALRVFIEADHPVEWAKTCQNLGNALADQGIRTAEPKGAELLAQAVAAHRDALRVTTEADHPVQWAMTQQNLGTALADQGARTAGPEGANLLAQAVTAYRKARRVNSEADQPVEWAKNQTNSAMAAEALAQHETTANPRPHLVTGLAHAEAALRVFDPETTRFYYDVAIKVRDSIQAALDDLP